MFRHSEIYSLLRERQQKQEAAALGTEGEAEIEHNQLKDLPAGVAGVNDLQRSLGDSRKPDSDDEEEYARFLEAEQRELQAHAAKKGKRKRDTADVLDERGRPPTARRIAREMDEAAADNTILDYGEEESPVGLGNLHHLENNGADRRTKVSYGDTSDTLGLEPAKTGSVPAVEGRKIWWPVIGGP